MKLAENPAKIGRVVSVIFVVAIFVQAINFFYYFMNSSGGQSTTINNLIMYLCMTIILSSIAISIVISVASKRHRNELQTGNDQNQTVTTSAVVDRANETNPAEFDINKK